MNLLAVETSTDRGSCALWQDGRVSERVCPAGEPHSQTLLPLVRDLMRAAGLGFTQLDGIAFGAGPGAFTGLRVACGVAQGLAVAAALPVVPVCGLAAMAAATDAPRVLALLDARMGEVYAGAWRRRDDDGGYGGYGEYELDGKIRVTVPTDVYLPAGADWLACGNALAAYPALAERLGAAGVSLRADILPTAAAIATIAAAGLVRGEGVDPALAAPLYVRDKVAKTIGERLGEGGRA